MTSKILREARDSDAIIGIEVNEDVTQMGNRAVRNPLLGMLKMGRFRGAWYNSQSTSIGPKTSWPKGEHIQTRIR